MAVELVTGGVVGAAFGEVFALLHETVKNVISQALMFKSTLERLKSTLDGLAPVVEEIRQLSKTLRHPENETKSLIEQMEKGTKLVVKCSKVQCWNYCFKAHYASELLELDEAIVRFCQVDMVVQNTRNVLETLVGVNRILENLDVKKKHGILSCAVPRPPDFTVGLDLPLKELKTMLLKKEVSVLLLTALGGCGKTTLVKMLCSDEEIKGIYMDNIFFVNISKNPNLKVIVQKLFSHKGDDRPEFQSDEDAINQLEQLLNQIGPNPILLILDDVWPGSVSLIEKFQFNIQNYKIVVTSRTAFPRFKFRYNLNPLNHEDAMTLFRHSAALQDGSSDIPEEDIEKIVRGCGGFPIVLKVIGGSLCGQPEVVWHSRLMKWSDGHSIFASDTELLAHLQESLEFFDEKVILKECFMDLGSFPENQRIPATTLIDMKEASEVDNYYNEDFVTQHDLLRDLAIHLSSQEPIGQRQRLFVDINGNNLPEWWTKQKQQLINARLLSISTDESFSSSWCNIQAPEVEALVLNFQTRNYTLPKFVEKMDKLKVIIVTNYGFLRAELSNFQQLRSLPNLKRIRLERVSIPSLSNAPVPLRSSKKISLFMCNIGQAFGNSTIQVSNSLPNLMEINIDYCNDLVELPAWLCDVVHLKKLSITNCHKLSALPEGIEKLVNLELLRLRSCTELSELPNSIRRFPKLSILDISDCLSISKLPKHIGELSNLKELHMKGCLRLRNQLPESVTNLEQLKLVVCDEERAMLWEPIKECLSNLKVMVAKEDINLNWLSIS
ncbi:probable disease resistance protein At5g66900 [Fagus crenata]